MLPTVSWHGSRGGNLVVLVGKKMGGKRWEPDCIFLPPIFLPACLTLVWESNKHRKNVE
jgi:hypothetical protein